MKQQKFTLLFFTGVITFVLSVPRKYYLIQQGMNWLNAQAYCQAKHTDLAIIESDDNIVEFQDEIQRQKFSSSAWIGMYNDINSWRWSMGNEPLGSLRPWNPAQPDNWQGHDSCGVIYSNGWSDVHCTDTYPFLCFDDTKTGNQRYIYISTAVTWPEAQNYCRTHYTDLASDRNTTEHTLIAGLTSGLAWLGLFRDTWKWIDHTNFSTISWMPGKPDNAQGNENCGYINNDQAIDAQCSNIMTFFCYSDIITEQQIMKVKVQSNQDVNSPEVKVAILEQIKQKLKDHVIAENITVNWRVQQDGQVFHKENEKNSGIPLV